MARTLLTENIWQQIQNTMRLHGCYRSKNSRNIMEVILWKLRTGSPWRDLPPHFGKWNTVFKRYRDWVKAGVFETIFASVNEDVDLEYAMIDGTIVKVHRHGQGAKGGLSNSL
ncbi:transposase [Acinetobacter variabilis]|jgi:transposase|nr:transposase [Acinetobacter indicus]UBI31451.1 transposase [Acinetobacter variabilis]